MRSISIFTALALVATPALLAGGAALDAGIDRVLAAFPDRSHVFNLGHGIGQHTPIAHVERLVARVRGGASA